MKEEGYRLNVGIVVANCEGKLLLCKRRRINSWQFPQGGIDKNEDCLLYTSPSPRDRQKSRMPSSA